MLFAGCLEMVAIPPNVVGPRRDPMPRREEQHETVLRDLRCRGSYDDLPDASAGGTADGDAVAGI
jgi:hypothetical protein